MRAIANKQLDEFPQDIKTCFVDHDIDGSDATDTVLEWINADKQLAHLSADEKKKQLDDLEFTEEMQGWAIGLLSGGWKMKLAPRARCSRAPTCCCSTSRRTTST